MSSLCGSDSDYRLVFRIYVNVRLRFSSPVDIASCNCACVITCGDDCGCQRAAARLDGPAQRPNHPHLLESKAYTAFAYSRRNVNQPTLPIKSVSSNFSSGAHLGSFGPADSTTILVPDARICRTTHTLLAGADVESNARPRCAPSCSRRVCLRRCTYIIRRPETA